jgi:hypothetical protein
MAEFDKFDLAVIKDCINGRRNQIMYDLQNFPEPSESQLMNIEADLSELARVYEKLQEQMNGEKATVTLS